MLGGEQDEELQTISSVLSLSQEQRMNGHGGCSCSMGDIDETTGLSFLTNMRRMEEDNTSKRLLPNKDCSMTIDNALWNFLKNLRKRYNFKLETLAHGLYLFYSSSTILTKQEDKDDETDQNSKDDKQDKFVLSLCIYISAKYLELQVPKLEDFEYYVNLNHLFPDQVFRDCEAILLESRDYNLDIVTVVDFVELFKQFPWLLPYCPGENFKKEELRILLLENMEEMLRNGTFLNKTAECSAIELFEQVFPRPLAKKREIKQVGFCEMPILFREPNFKFIRRTRVQSSCNPVYFKEEVNSSFTISLNNSTVLFESDKDSELIDRQEGKNVQPESRFKKLKRKLIDSHPDTMLLDPDHEEQSNLTINNSEGQQKGRHSYERFVRTNSVRSKRSGRGRGKMISLIDTPSPYLCPNELENSGELYRHRQEHLQKQESKTNTLSTRKKLLSRRTFSNLLNMPVSQ